MIIELAHYALTLVLMLALLQASVPLIGSLVHSPEWMAPDRMLAIMQFFLTTLAFAGLVYGFVLSDFSVDLVWQHSHSKLPLIYKITATWGNHEGSMLLWLLILTLFGALLALFGTALPQTLRSQVLSVQAMSNAAFAAFILFASNPFSRLENFPFEGKSLNPILQDIGLAIHPPLLYVGYVGFSIVFSFAVAALISGRIDRFWAAWVRPWVIVAWIFLTLGIAMGSYWAYYELGWGGWWFWDPVENASFMPWLLGTALLHCVIVMEKRDSLKSWTILLALLTFSLSLLGTFLVRSGILTSVHVFASDPGRGLAILFILCFFIGGSLLLYGLRVNRLKIGGIFAPLSRESALVLNNLLLSVACGGVLLGTLYPLILEFFHPPLTSLMGFFGYPPPAEKISVGAGYFNATFVPLMIPLLLAVPVGIFLPWKQAKLAPLLQRLYTTSALSLLAMIIVFIILGKLDMSVLAWGVIIWLFAGITSEFFWRASHSAKSLSDILRRITRFPASQWGSTFGHLGLALLVLGVVCATSLSSEKVVLMHPGETIRLAGFGLTFEQIKARKGVNYTEQYAAMTVRHKGRLFTALTPAKRFYPARQSPTTEAAIYSHGLSQLYLSLGEITDKGAVVVRAYYKPLVLLIWLGATLGALGGVISLAGIIRKKFKR